MPASQPAVGAVIVLAAGAGTRMRSSTPKVLHPIAGKPLLWHAINAAAGLRPGRLIAVIGHGREQVGQYLSAEHPDVTQAVQDQQLGTGHAVACALGDSVIEGTVVVTYGDVPLLTTETLRGLVLAHAEQGNAVTVLSADVADATGYGRIVRDGSGVFEAIVEHLDASEDQRSITEINSGVYAFDGEVLAGALPRLASANAKAERYLTDVVSLAVRDGLRVGTVPAGSAEETAGVNDRVQLADLARRLNNRLVRAAQLSGVTISDPATTWLHADVRIGADTHVLPATFIEAGTVIGENCVIGPDTTLSNCTVADGATVLRSHCVGASIGAGASVGPFTFLRPDAVLEEGAKAGAYVEVKKSTIGRKAKVPHLSYIGDATIGERTNIGAGTITANYDGAGKYPTLIGRDVFIGTNTTLVAPVTVADGAFVAAGSTIVEHVGPGDLAVARGRQHSSTEWVLRRRTGTTAEESARAAGAGSAPAANAADVGDVTDTAAASVKSVTGEGQS